MKNIHLIHQYTDRIRSITDQVIVVPNNEVYIKFVEERNDPNIFVKGTEPRQPVKLKLDFIP